MAHNDTNVLDRDDVEVQEPSMYKVLLLNDDYTPMDFVVLILQSIFGKSMEEAIQLMMDVHKKGKGLAGVYTYDIAETKKNDAMTIAKQNQYPFRVEIEEE